MEDKRSNYIALAAALAALGALLVCSQAALESARAGLSLCAQMIVPSLLPFFMLSSLLQQLGLPGIRKGSSASAARAHRRCCWA